MKTQHQFGLCLVVLIGSVLIAEPTIAATKGR